MGADIENLPQVVRHIAKKNTRIVNRIAVRIAAMPPAQRQRVYREAEATFRETAEANGLAASKLNVQIGRIKALRNMASNLSSLASRDICSRLKGCRDQKIGTRITIWSKARELLRRAHAGLIGPHRAASNAVARW